MTSDPKDWRSLKVRENIPVDYSYFHEVQYIASNYLFNQKIVNDKMYINKIWTEKYKNLIKNIWYSINQDNYDKLKKFKIKK